MKITTSGIWLRIAYIMAALSVSRAQSAEDMRPLPPPLQAPSPTEKPIGAARLPVYFIDSFGPQTMYVPGQQEGAETGTMVGIDTTDKSLGFQGAGLGSGDSDKYRWTGSLLLKAKAEADLAEVLSGNIDPTWEGGGGFHMIRKIPPPQEELRWLTMINVLALYRRETVEIGETEGEEVVRATTRRSNGAKAQLQYGGIAQSNSSIAQMFPALAGNLAFSASIGFERRSNYKELKEADFEGRKVRVGELKTVNRTPITVTMAFSSPNEGKVSKAFSGILGLIPGAELKEGSKFVPVYGAFYTFDPGTSQNENSYGGTLGFRSIEGGRYAFPLRLTWMRSDNGSSSGAETSFGVTVVLGFFD